ncbi:MAG TPA: hypothetical protein VKB79_29845 [Bryobacteraceae bacterium]|nr:hypothetical protein [Bryobacteraceae bacterium]
MAGANDRWWNDPELWIEIFALLNISFLALDIYLAHSANQFRARAEYIPLLYSLIAPPILVVALTQRKKRRLVWKSLGHLVGVTAILVGLAGMVLHLDSHFFYERTIRSLTYSAPFAAPLAYTGLGCLLVMNRMVNAESVEWAHWILLFTLGGFFGNFIFSLADHAANGFFFAVEWTPVFASALAIGFLCIPVFMRVSTLFINVCFGVLLLEGVVGVWGFALHTIGNLRGPSTHAYDNFIFGAPAIAPLLFPNLMLLGLIGLWQLRNTEYRQGTLPA